MVISFQQSMAKRVQAQRSNSTSTFEALEGLIPVCEDWHTKPMLVNGTGYYTS